MVASLTIPTSYSIFSGNDQKDDSTDSKPVISLRIKNTFIDTVDASFCEVSNARSRSSSAPPKMSGKSASEDKENHPNVPLSACSPTAAMVASKQGAMRPRLPPPPPLEPAPVFIVEPSASNRHGGPLATFCQNQIAYRKPLNVRARPYGASQTKTEPPPPEARAHFSEIIQALMLALRSCCWLDDLQLVDSADGYLLQGTFQAKHYSQVHSTFKQAVDNMLAAASASTDVYVLGYEGNPFSPTTSPTLRRGVSVTARLAVVSNLESACWDLLKKGFCKYGHVCRWHHPQWQMPVNIVLNPSDSSSVH